MLKEGWKERRRRDGGWLGRGVEEDIKLSRGLAEGQCAGEDIKEGVRLCLEDV